MHAGRAQAPSYRPFDPIAGYYGQTVKVASRIAEYARPGEVLVSQQVVDASAAADASFTEIGPVELKGVGGEMQLHAAHRPG